MIFRSNKSAEAHSRGIKCAPPPRDLDNTRMRRSPRDPAVAGAAPRRAGVMNKIAPSTLNPETIACPLFSSLLSVFSDLARRRTSRSPETMRKNLGAKQRFLPEETARAGAAVVSRIARPPICVS